MLCQLPCQSISVSIDFRGRRLLFLLIFMSVDLRVVRFPLLLIFASVDFRVLISVSVDNRMYSKDVFFEKSRKSQ